MQSEHMNEADSIDARLTRALERKPAVDVPADFAVRVAGKAPVRRVVAVPAARYGLAAARIGMGILVIALVVLAMRSTSHTAVGAALQWVLCAELVVLAVWLGGVWRPMES
jgi:hypothetical protein